MSYEQSLNTVCNILTLRSLYITSSKYNNSITEMIIVNEKLLNMFSIMENQNLSMVHYAIHMYNSYYDFLNSINEFNKSLIIGEVMIESHHTFNWTKGDHEAVKLSYDIATKLYERKEFNKSKKIASYTLHCFNDTTRLSMVHEYVGTCMILSKATYSLNNFSGANMVLVSTLKFISENNLTHILRSDYNEACSYSVRLGNFEFLYSCYVTASFQVLRENLHKCTSLVFYFFFGLPLNCTKSTKNRLRNTDLPIELYPSITRLSKSTTLNIKDSSMSKIDFGNWPSIMIVGSSITALIKRFTTLKYQNWVCILLNVTSIFIRVYLTVIILSICSSFLSYKILLTTCFGSFLDFIARIYFRLLSKSDYDAVTFKILLYVYNVSAFFYRYWFFYSYLLPLWFIFQHIQLLLQDETTYNIILISNIVHNHRGYYLIDFLIFTLLIFLLLLCIG